MCQHALSDFKERCINQKIGHCRKLSLLTRFYFAAPLPSINQAQLMYFASLVISWASIVALRALVKLWCSGGGLLRACTQVQWLLSLSGHAVTMPPEQASTQVLCRAIVASLERSGFTVPQVPPSDLEPGWGKAVILVLSTLAERALMAQHFQWKQTLHPPEM